jgi:hypothetical protein
MHRLPAAVYALSLFLAGACGGSNPSGPSTPVTPPPTSADVSIVPGASQLTTNAFDPNPKTFSLGGAAQVSVRWVNADGGGGYGGARESPTRSRRMTAASPRRRRSGQERRIPWR